MLLGADVMGIVLNTHPKQKSQAGNISFFNLAITTKLKCPPYE